MSRVSSIHRWAALWQGSAAAPLPLLGAGAPVVRVGLPSGYRVALSPRRGRYGGEGDDVQSRHRRQAGYCYATAFSTWRGQAVVSS
jgi:hypothetical protein